MASPFEGKWKLEDGGANFDDYMKALGVSYMMRKMGGSAKPTMIIIREGDTWTMKTESVKNTEFQFKFGVEFDEVTADGRKAKSVITKDNDRKWTHVQSAEISSTMIREVVDDNTLIATCIAKDVTCRRTYKRA